jgi:hypothetical protein
MAITVWVQNINHERVRSFSDDAGVLGNLAEQAKAKRSAMGAIYRHGDAMLNAPQLRWLVEEIDEFEAVRLTAAERHMCEALREAASEAIRLRGYLYFMGD